MFFTATGLNPNTFYSFKVEAQNVKGYSVKSSQISIRAAGVPATMEAPVTTINSANVDISWNVPSNGGSPITRYTIKVRKSDGVTYTEDSTNCDGSNTSILASSTCSIPISTLRTSPYSLAWGDSVYVIVTATNVVGTSLASPEGNGAILLTYPDPPVSLANDVAVTTEMTIGITWSEGAANGGTPVIDYRISYVLEGGSSYTQLASGITTKAYQTNTLTAGNSYTFKLESRNEYGYSQSYSNLVTILQAQVPDPPTNLLNDAAVTSST